MSACKTAIELVEWELHEMEMAGDVDSPAYLLKCKLLDSLYAMKGASA